MEVPSDRLGQYYYSQRAPLGIPRSSRVILRSRTSSADVWLGVGKIKAGKQHTTVSTFGEVESSTARSV